MLILTVVFWFLIVAGFGAALVRVMVAPDSGRHLHLGVDVLVDLAIGEDAPTLLPSGHPTAAAAAPESGWAHVPDLWVPEVDGALVRPYAPTVSQPPTDPQQRLPPCIPRQRAEGAS